MKSKFVWSACFAVGVAGCGTNVEEDVGEILFSHSGHLELLDTGSGEFKPLTFPPPDAADRQPRWSANGTQLAFIRTSQESSALMLLDLERGEVRNLGGQNPSSPNLDPRGQFLYYSDEDPAYDSRDNPLGWDNGRCRHQLMKLDIGTGRRDELLETDETKSALSPLLSPDGQKLAYALETTEGGWLDGTQQVLDIETGDVRDLLGDVAFGRAWLADSSGVFYATVGLWFASGEAEPAWLSEDIPTILQVETSPSADRIAFTTSQVQRSGDDILTRTAIQTAAWPSREQEGPLHQAPDGFYVSLHAWSPDGAHLLITTKDQDGSLTSDDPQDEDQHQLVDVQTGDLRVVAAGNDLQPVSWRPAP